MDGRLSEDIDLIARVPRHELVRAIPVSVSRAILRTHGRAIWDPAWNEHSEVEGAVLKTSGGVAMQLLNQAGYQAWPTELRSIEQRYLYAPPARLWVPTIHAFAAWKTATWFDRHAPRDLYDLWGLARIGALNAEAAELFRRLGPTGSFPSAWMFDRAPLDDEWRSQLAAQTRLTVTPSEAIESVRSAWSAVVAEFE